MSIFKKCCRFLVHRPIIEKHTDTLYGGLDRYRYCPVQKITKNILIDWIVNVLVIVNIQVIKFYIFTHLTPAHYLPHYGAVQFFFFFILYLYFCVRTILQKLPWKSCKIGICQKQFATRTKLKLSVMCHPTRLKGIIKSHPFISNQIHFYVQALLESFKILC